MSCEIYDHFNIKQNPEVSNQGDILVKIIRRRNNPMSPSDFILLVEPDQKG